jgi:hypothetical protein
VSGVRLDLPRRAELSSGRARPGLGACLTSWGSYGGEQVLREAVGVPEDWMIASSREEVTVRLECAPVPGMGWMFLADPDGNWIELFGAL